MIEAFLLIIFPFCMIFSGVSDLISMTIPNRVSVILIVGFSIFAPFTGMDWLTYGFHFLAGGVVLLAGFILFITGQCGGGDAKLLAATAVWIGFNEILINYILISMIIGGILACLIILYQKSFFPYFIGHNIFLRNFNTQEKGIPYGIALGFSGLIFYPQTSLGLWLIGRLSA